MGRADRPADPRRSGIERRLRGRWATVNEELAFSYFYPTTDDQVGLLPWDDPDQFAWRYLGSYASTRLNYSQNSAEDGSLHETEFIAPTSRNGQPVNLVGYIFEEAGCTLSWKDALPRLQMGGERTYGWGRVDLGAINATTEQLFGRLPMALDGARPGLHLDKGAPLMAHALASGENAVRRTGRSFPLVGRETTQCGTTMADISPPR